ncbi:MAG: chorismate-binding protein [Bacteroidota bacterium]|nr:chorismate-binding protein [Bacteroidota bacterium]
MNTIKTKTKQLLSDTITPVALYLKIRDKFPGSILLESGDYHGGEHSLSYLCLQPIAGFIVQNGIASIDLPGEEPKKITVENPEMATRLLDEFGKAVNPVNDEGMSFNGIFGYLSFESAALFDKIKLRDSKDILPIPDIRYHFYKYLIVINHHQNKATLVENLLDGEESSMEKLEHLLLFSSVSSFPFALKGDEESNMSDQDYMEMVKKGKSHCRRGDVFQIVLSRSFSQQYTGDEFNVYRSLRYINPSPWMFYFDYGDYSIFGSSPEHQILIRDNKATISPIAGTYPRTGNDAQDLELAERLSADPKESSEHVMLVDLARNDLSRHARNVSVTAFKEVQYFSHVLHLVSTVTGEMVNGATPVKLLADTFPAGTLSGAPKVMAIELISKYEPTRRGFYGGAIGKIGFDGSLSHAITIRSFLSKNNRLYFQAGAGIVDKSVEQNELLEVKNKLGALRSALKMAITI